LIVLLKAILNNIKCLFNRQNKMTSTPTVIIVLQNSDNSEVNVNIL